VITMEREGSPLSWLAAPGDQSKIRLPGTNRARPPADTLRLAGRVAATAGITRVADITRLDFIGIPTFHVIRPASRTLTVSMGKGVTPELAKLSAMMEAIEMWHVEQPLSPVVTAAPREVSPQLCYPVHRLPLSSPSLLHDGLPLDWVAARSLADGAPTLLPVDVVRLSLEQKTEWVAPAFFESTNGLASGNTLVEATLHALYEVIERDAMTVAVGGNAMGVPVDPRTTGSPVVDDLCTLIERAGVYLEVHWVASPTGLPCFLCWICCDDYPAAMFGFGCHLSPQIALSRAITEAAQSRLGYISGARDDLQEDIDQPGTRRTRSGQAADIRELIREPVVTDSLLDDLEYVVKQATAAFSSPPLVVDLTREDIGVPVVKVVAPGARICPEVL
jgi:ribosomal protein S12 methylthiotransferase accessory factor